MFLPCQRALLRRNVDGIGMKGHRHGERNLQMDCSAVPAASRINISLSSSVLQNNVEQNETKQNQNKTTMVLTLA
jgi:hypothetical protein